MLADDPDQVDDGVAARHVLLEPRLREDVAFDSRDRVESPEIRFRAPPDETADAVAFSAEPLEHRVTHEAGGAGDEDLHAGP